MTQQKEYTKIALLTVSGHKVPHVSMCFLILILKASLGDNYFHKEAEAQGVYIKSSELYMWTVRDGFLTQACLPAKSELLSLSTEEIIEKKVSLKYHLPKYC